MNSPWLGDTYINFAGSGLTFSAPKLVVVFATAPDL